MCIRFPTCAVTNYDAPYPLADVSSGQESSDYQEDVLGPREHHHVQRGRGCDWRGLSDDHGTHRRAPATFPAAHSDPRALTLLWADPPPPGDDPPRVGDH